MRNSGVPADRSIYVAGPSGFTEPGRRFHDDVLVPALVAAGLTALDPWQIPGDPFGAANALPPGAKRLAALQDANRTAGARNESLIRSCAAVFALLDGTDIDSGTAAEIGFAAALDLSTVGLRTDFRLAGDNEAATVNLQVEHFINTRGGVITTSLEAAVEALVERAR
jgi:nucleoside 2-deoxyribosyltransferase